jgi:ATP-dependent 26S proteasome regulatory subunit
VKVNSVTTSVAVDDMIIECNINPLEHNTADVLPNTSYNAISGASNHLTTIPELIELFLRNLELWTQLCVNTPHRVLLKCPLGCGKTTIAQVVASGTSAYFFIINCLEVISKKTNESEPNLCQASEETTANTTHYNGVILFINELNFVASPSDKATHK